MSDAQKTPIVRGLGAKMTSRVLQHVENMAGRAPASIALKQGGGSGNQADTDDSHTIAMIKFETDGSVPLPMVQLPIHGSQYERRPWQGGEKGFVTTADFMLGGMSSLGSQLPAPFLRPGNLSALVFHAIGNMDFTPTDDKDSHLNYGKSGTIHRDVDKKSQVKVHVDNGVSMSTGGDGSGADGPHNMKATTGGTETNTTATHTTNAPGGHNVPMGPQTVKGNITSSQGNITAATGNISAPSGAVSGLSGNFASGSIGGLGMIAGIISGGGSPGSPAVTIDTNTGAASFAASVSAPRAMHDVAVLRPLTYAQLAASYPPSAALAGGRATVSDATTGSFGQEVNVGGGNAFVPVFCQTVTATDGSGTVTYRWIVA